MPHRRRSFVRRRVLALLFIGALIVLVPLFYLFVMFSCARWGVALGMVCAVI